MKGLVNSFWSYSSETPFHGFNIARIRSNKCEIFSWLLAVVICMCIATQQTVVLVQNYQAEPTDTVVAAVLNSTYILPNPTLCFDISNPNLITPNPDIWQTEITAAGDINKLLANLANYTKETIYKSSDNTKGLIKLLYLMFAEITTIDVYFINPGLLPPILWKHSESTVTHKVLMSSNQSFGDLLKLTTSLICKLMNVSVQLAYFDRAVTLTNVVKIFDVCNVDRVTHFDGQIGCLKIHGNGDKIAFMGPTDMLSLSFESDRWDPNLGLPKQFSIDLAGRAYCNQYSDSGNVYMTEFHTRSKISLQLLNEFNQLNLKRHPCGTVYNQFDCQRLCGAAYTQLYCGCWPLYFVDLKPQNSTFCAANFNNLHNSTLMPDYHICTTSKNPKVISHMGLECISACPSGCKYQQFMFFTDAKTQLSSGGTTYLDLKIRDFSYTKVDEIVTKGWSSFMNEFGGSLGVWLGGSILALVHLPVYFGKLVIAAVKSKKSQPKTTISTKELYF